MLAYNELRVYTVIQTFRTIYYTAKAQHSSYSLSAVYTTSQNENTKQ